MKKRYILIILTGLLAVSPVYQSAYGAEDSIQEERVAKNVEITDSEYIYIVVNDQVKIYGYTGADTDVVIPAEIDGMPVVFVSGFKDNTTLKSVTIPEGVSVIGAEAFSGCTNLQNIHFLGSINSLLPYAFSNCENLEEVELPLGLEYIEMGVFDGCKNLKKIFIPESVKYIYVFGGCFSGCDNLTQITVDSHNTTYCDVDGVLFSKDKTKLWKYPKGRIATGYTIPDSVKYINNSAFYGCEKLESLYMPDTMEEIGRCAFLGCKSLKNIKLSVSGAYEYGTFKDCESLEYVDIPEGVEFLGNHIFAGCTCLNTIVIPKSIYYISSNFFEGCTHLESILCLSGEVELYNWEPELDVTIYAPLGGLTEEMANSIGISIRDASEYLSAPILSDISTTDSTITLTWEPVNRARGYYIYRKSDGGDWEQVGAVNEPDITSYTDETVVVGTSYTYTACAYTALGSFLGPRDEIGKTIEIPVGVSLTGAITSYGVNTTPVTVTLLDGTTEIDKITTTDGTYTFASVPSGTYTLQVSQENHTTRSYNIIVLDEAVIQNVEICPVGDITGDGKVNTRDLNRLYAHVNGTNPLTGYEFDWGDVTGDGKINTRDLNRLYAHISEMNPLW